MVATQTSEVIYNNMIEIIIESRNINLNNPCLST